MYDSYNALAIGCSLSGQPGQSFCSIAVYRNNYLLHLGFHKGNDLSYPEKKLLGSANQYRYLLVKEHNEFPASFAKQLLKQAYLNTKAGMGDDQVLVEASTIIKSVSAEKREKTKRSSK